MISVLKSVLKTILGVKINYFCGGFLRSVHLYKQLFLHFNTMLVKNPQLFEAHQFDCWFVVQMTQTCVIHIV